MAHRNSGFTMIEVLVAMLVLGASAMAMVMLQLQALRSSSDSALRTRAMMMAVELAELRAEYRAAGSPGDADPYLLNFDGGTAAARPNGCSSAPCTPETFAHDAVASWTTRLSDDFPGARAEVCRDGRAPATVAGDWTCSGNVTAPVYIKLGWRAAQRSGVGGAAPDRPQMAVFIGY